MSKKHYKEKHKEYCLCWKNCKHFKPENREENCEIANANFKTCIDYNVVLPVWECPKYEPKIRVKIKG